MISLHDLMHHPNNIQPLGTHKGAANKPTNLRIDIKALFLSSSNVSSMSVNLHSIYRQNGGRTSFSKFKDLSILLMKKFAKDNNLYDYETAEDSTMGIYNYPVILKTINRDFLSFAHKYFNWNDYNIAKGKVEVGETGSRELKHPKDLVPDDYGTLEVWREQFTQALGRNFRDNNKIPVGRISLHTRHYDRSNEGLKHDDSDRASLDVPIHGYTSVQTYNDLNNYRSEEWFSM